MTKPTGIWATENWCPRISRGLFLGVAGPIVLGFAVYHASRLKALTCDRYGEAIQGAAFTPSLASFLVYVAAVFLALGRAHAVGRELPFLRYFRQRGFVFGASDSIFLSCIFGMGVAFVLPIFLSAVWFAFRCIGTAYVLASIWGLSISSLFVVLFLILPLRFLLRSSRPDPHQSLPPR